MTLRKLVSVFSCVQRGLLAGAVLALLHVVGTARAAQFIPADRLTSGLITCLCQDARGFVWIGTEYGLNKFDGYRFTHYLHRSDDSTTIANNEITALHIDDEGTLWVGTSRGLSRYDEQTDGFRPYRFPDDRRPRCGGLATDAHGSLLIGTAGYGLYSLQRGSSAIHFESRMNSRQLDMFYGRMHLDRHGQLWRGSHVDTLSMFPWGQMGGNALPADFLLPYGQPMAFLDCPGDVLLVACQRGVLRHDRHTRQLADAGFDLSALGARATTASALCDRQGQLFVGTAADGLFVAKRGLQRFERVQAPPFNDLLGKAHVSALMEDAGGNLWVACRGQGLLLLDKEADAFAVWPLGTPDSHTADGGIMAIAPDGQGGILCPTGTGGLFRFDRQGTLTPLTAAPQGVRCAHRDANGTCWLGTAQGHLLRYNPANGTSTPVQTFAGHSINCMADDGRGTLFVGVQGVGLAIVDTATGQCELQTMADKERPGGYLCNNWINSLFIDSRGMLWICTTGGTSAMKPQGRVFNSLGWNQLLDAKQCYAACETATGDVLIATEDGLCRYDHATAKAVPLAGAQLAPLHDKMVCSMQCDAQGTVWMATNMGIWQLSADFSRVARHASAAGRQTYVPGAGLTIADDRGQRIFFGTSDGIITFRPADVAADTVRPAAVQLARMLVNNRFHPLSDGHSYHLGNKENTVQLEFALFDYRWPPATIVFQWRMNGSKTWHTLDEGTSMLVLNELQPGNYRIEVRAVRGGLTSAANCRIDIGIAQPWYRSWWAWLLYATALAAIVAMVLMAYLRRQRRNLEEAKMRFLINATHDIRSPLTLIMAAVQKLSTQAGDGTPSHDLLTGALDTIDRNAKRLLLLVNQILDERKIDKGQMRLHCRETEMTAFIGSIVKLYEYNATQRNIALEYHHPQAKVMAWIDRTQFDKVVANLLGNAFKYTPDGGSIAVELSADLTLTITDSGLGFSSADTEKYFRRFYQGKNSRDLHIDGTGIGLNLSRNLVEMHGGRIEAHNRTDGHSGAVLTVVLPQGNAHLRPEQMETADEQRPTPTQNVRLLVVDDDPEIGRFIEGELGQWYHFAHAPNGREALKMLLTDPERYDLVVSDVMMPEMDGLTLLRSIKQNPQVSHLPVILLTSKADVEHRLEGLRKGADAYLAKPFQMDELHVLADNLLAGVRRLRGKFSGALQQQQRVENVEVRGNDDAFMERVMKAVNAHLSDPDLTVDVLTREVGISRAQLHRKMKEITGVSTTEFIRNLRLEQAARLIAEKKINITQVAYSVGFNNQTHFSTVFKRHFGMTPTEYAAKGSGAKPA